MWFILCTRRIQICWCLERFLTCIIIHVNRSLFNPHSTEVGRNTIELFYKKFYLLTPLPVPPPLVDLKKFIADGLFWLYSWSFNLLMKNIKLTLTPDVWRWEIIYCWDVATPLPFMIMLLALGLLPYYLPPMTLMLFDIWLMWTKRCG